VINRLGAFPFILSDDFPPIWESNFFFFADEKQVVKFAWPNWTVSNGINNIRKFLHNFGGVSTSACLLQTSNKSRQCQIKKQPYSKPSC